MAEFDEIDGLVRDALGRAAQPGDSAGVADAIRSRVASGDAGASVAGSTAPGWGSGVGSWLPWVGLLVVGAVVGSAVGVAGLAGRPAGETVADIPVELGETAAIYDCVDGAVLGRVPANTRVLAVARSDDSLWLGVRDPQTLGGTVWVPLGDVSLDSAASLPDLPVGGACPTTAVALPAPVVTEAPAPPAPPAPKPPAPKPDTTPPAISQYGASPGFLQSCPGTDTANLFAVASDDRGVTRVEVGWVGSSSGLSQLGPSGGQWVGTLTVPTDSSGPITLTFRAYDAAGNVSAAKTQTLSVSSCVH